MEGSLDEMLFKRIVKFAKGKKLTASDLIIITTFSMQYAQQFPTALGFEKKQAVINAISKFVDETDVFDEEGKVAAKIFIQMTLPGMIDTIIAAYKHKLRLGNAIASCCMGRTKKIKSPQE